VANFRVRRQNTPPEARQLAKPTPVVESIAACPQAVDLATVSNAAGSSNRSTISARAPNKVLSAIFAMLGKLQANLKTEIIAPCSKTGMQLKELYLSVLVCDHARPAMIFFPQQSWLFPRLSESVCEKCFEELQIDLPLLGFCRLRNGKQATLPVASGAAYQECIRQLIRQFKHDGDRLLATDLASIMSNGWPALKEFMPATAVVLVPVPLHRDRQRSRGFNQAQLLAKELKTNMFLEVDCRALTRTKRTKSQQLLSKEERMKNVRGAFVGDAKRLKGKAVVLIDDVCTSGSTLVECAEEVLRCGAKNVVALTVARAIMSKSEDS
jgi:ComF family protein